MSVPPVLASLHLSPLELTALRRQGSVIRVVRGRTGFAFKLRLRLQGKQVARYIGTDPATAATLAAELSEWQSSAGRSLSSLASAGRRGGYCVEARSK